MAGASAYWLAELTLPDLYTANRHKIADIVIRADELLESEDEILEAIKRWRLIVALRLPGLIAFREEGVFRVEVEPPLPTGHMPVYQDPLRRVNPPAW